MANGDLNEPHPADAQIEALQLSYGQLQEKVRKLQAHLMRYCRCCTCESQRRMIAMQSQGETDLSIYR